MGTDANTAATDISVEETLRLELALGDRSIATTRPVLRHLLAGGNHSLLGDDIVARTRGCVTDCARLLLIEQARAASARDIGSYVQSRQPAFAQSLLLDANIVAHAHAQVFEAALAERLRERNGIDPVLAQVLREAVIDGGEALAPDAMQVLTAQARFVQQQKRMSMPPLELPADLFHRALVLLCAQAEGTDDEGPANAAGKSLRAIFDESAARIGQIARFLTGSKPESALSLERAGLSIFVSAVAMASGEDRDIVLLSCADGQFARLSLTLRAAGLAPDEVREQFLYLHPDIALPESVAAIDRGRARAMLRSADPQAAL